MNKNEVAVPLTSAEVKLIRRLLFDLGRPRGNSTSANLFSKTTHAMIALQVMDSRRLRRLRARSKRAAEVTTLENMLGTGELEERP